MTTCWGPAAADGTEGGREAAAMHHDDGCRCAQPPRAPSRRHTIVSPHATPLLQPHRRCPDRARREAHRPPRTPVPAPWSLLQPPVSKPPSQPASQPAVDARVPRMHECRSRHCCCVNCACAPRALFGMCLCAHDCAAVVPAATWMFSWTRTSAGSASTCTRAAGPPPRRCTSAT